MTFIASFWCKFLCLLGTIKVLTYVITQYPPRPVVIHHCRHRRLHIPTLAGVWGPRSLHLRYVTAPWGAESSWECRQAVLQAAVSLHSATAACQCQEPQSANCLHRQTAAGVCGISYAINHQTTTCRYIVSFSNASSPKYWNKAVCVFTPQRQYYK